MCVSLPPSLSYFCCVVLFEKKYGSNLQPTLEAVKIFQWRNKELTFSILSVLERPLNYHYYDYLLFFLGGALTQWQSVQEWWYQLNPYWNWQPDPTQPSSCCQWHIHSPVVAVIAPVSFGQKSVGSFGFSSGARIASTGINRSSATDPKNNEEKDNLQCIIRSKNG